MSKNPWYHVDWPSTNDDETALVHESHVSSIDKAGKTINVDYGKANITLIVISKGTKKALTSASKKPIVLSLDPISKLFIV